MNAERGAVYGVVLVTVLASVASGPLVSGVDLTHEPDVLELDPGNGSVTVTSVDVPEDGFYLEPGKFGSDVYYLETPKVRANVSNVEGQPLVNYKVRITEANFTNLRIYFLGEEEEKAGGLNLEMPRSSLEPSVGANESYEAEVLVVVRDDEGDGPRVVHRENVTVEVGDDGRMLGGGMSS